MIGILNKKHLTSFIFSKKEDRKFLREQRESRVRKRDTKLLKK